MNKSILSATPVLGQRKHLRRLAKKAKCGEVECITLVRNDQIVKRPAHFSGPNKVLKSSKHTDRINSLLGDVLDGRISQDALEKAFPDLFVTSHVHREVECGISVFVPSTSPALSRAVGLTVMDPSSWVQTPYDRFKADAVGRTSVETAPVNLVYDPVCGMVFKNHKRVLPRKGETPWQTFMRLREEGCTCEGRGCFLCD